MDGDELNAGSAEATESMSAGSGDAGSAPPGSESPAEAANAASAPLSGGNSWTPPSREAYEEAQRYADLGREFAPYAAQIRDLVKRGFTPAEAKAEVRARAADSGDDLDVYSDFTKYDAFWQNVGRNPQALKSLIQKTALSAAKEKFDAYEKMQKDFEALKQSHQELRGWAVRGNAAFQTNPEFAKYEPAAMQLVQRGVIGDLTTAVEFVRMQAELKDLKAKAAAAAKAATAPAPAAKPSPRQDASGPRAGAGRASGATPEPTSGRGRASDLKNFMRSKAKELRGA